MTTKCGGSPDCPGTPVTGFASCLGHLRDGELDSVLGEVRGGGRALEAAGAPLSSERVKTIVARAPRENGRPVLEDAAFDGATFTGHANFRRVVFSGQVSFADATFHGNADFVNARFDDRASFDDATFEQSLWLFDARFASGVSFAECRFKHELAIRRFVVIGDVDLHRATFEESARIEVAADHIDARETDFKRSLTLTAEWAEIDLGGATFGGPSVIRSPETATTDNELRLHCLRREHQVPAERMRREARTARARVVSLRGARVGELTLSGMDLRACLFVGAHDLEKLRLEGGNVFAMNPRGDRRTLAEEHGYRARLNSRGRSGWQPAASLSPSFLDPAPASLDAGEIATIYRGLRKGREDSKDEPGAADFYYGEMEMRRRARPASSPGLRGRLSLGAERAVLWIYWLTAGYGLRGGRAVICLLTLLVVFTPLFDLYGFRDRRRPFASAVQLDATYNGKRLQPPEKIAFPPSLSDVTGGLQSVEAWNYTAGTATALFGAPDAQLTQFGRTLRVALRLLGPLFIALALLSIRGRIKR
jgi:uncharacterized protein YjbI with pentapeptide repeats